MVRESRQRSGDIEESMFRREWVGETGECKEENRLRGGGRVKWAKGSGGSR